MTHTYMNAVPLLVPDIHFTQSVGPISDSPLEIFELYFTPEIFETVRPTSTLGTLLNTKIGKN